MNSLLLISQSDQMSKSVKSVILILLNRPFNCHLAKSNQTELLLKQIFNSLQISYHLMNFPFAQGCPDDRYPFYPPLPQAMPWNLPAMGFPMPMAAYPQQPNFPFFPQQTMPNFFVGQQYNNFYGYHPSFPSFNNILHQHPQFQKLFQQPKPIFKANLTQNTDKTQGKQSQKLQKMEVISISDELENGKNAASKTKEVLNPREKKVYVELKRLSNKRFSKLQPKDREQLEVQLKKMAQKIGSEEDKTPKARETAQRSRRLTKKYTQLNTSNSKRETSKKQSLELPSREQTSEEIHAAQFEFKLPRILTIEEFSWEKKSLKQSLFLRNFKTL